MLNYETELIHLETLKDAPHRRHFQQGFKPLLKENSKYIEKILQYLKHSQVNLPFVGREQSR